MAIKKTDKKPVKPAAKKVVKKKVRDIVKPAIEVPRGGQAIHPIYLTPVIPSGGVLCDWSAVHAETNEPLPEPFMISFSEKSSTVQYEFERAVLVVNLVDSNPGGSWRFALEGINVWSVEGKQRADFATEITNFGKTLLIYAHSPGLGKETIKFSYVAAYTDIPSGQTSIYESKDPIIVITRPKP